MFGNILSKMFGTKGQDTISNKTALQDCEKSIQYVKDGTIYCSLSGCTCPFNGFKHKVIWQNNSIDRDEYCEVVIAYKKGIVEGMCKMENKRLCKHFCTKKSTIYGKCKLTAENCTSTPDKCNLNRIYNDGYNEGLLSKESK